MDKNEVSEKMKEWTKYFKYDHLPDHLQDISKPFSDLASMIIVGLPDGFQKQQCLSKLLEAKDCAVRSVL